MFNRRDVWIIVIILFSSLLYSMGIRCNRREALVCMEGVVSMVVYLITSISVLMLVVGMMYGIYMAIWGVYDE